jgi:hypothetical protein
VGLNNLEWPTSHLAYGYYFIKIELAGHQKTIKVFKN